MKNNVFSSNKPYLFRAILDWLLDNQATPYILVDTQSELVEVPEEHIQDGQIVLNVSPSAVQKWQVDNQAISFSARFGGVSRNIYVPMFALMAIYSQENGLGMAFPAEEDERRERVEDEGLPRRLEESSLPSVETELSESHNATPVKKVSGKNKNAHLTLVK